MSSCGFAIFGSDAVNGTGSVMFDEALRGYYRLTDDDIITQEHIDGITSLVIKLSDINSITDKSVTESWLLGNEFADDIYVDYIINGKEVNAFPKIIDATRFKEVYLKAVNDYYRGKETLTEEDIERYSNTDNPYITTNAARKLSAFFKVVDPNDPNLNKRQAVELKLVYPFITDYAVAIFDPYSSTRESIMIASYYHDAGLLDGYTTINGCFDASSLSVFKNLETVIYKGVRPLNENLPVGAISRYYDYEYNNLLGN
jgi:hypothetical protein